MEKFKDVNSAIEKLKSINDRLKQLEKSSVKSVDFSKEEEKILKKGTELKKYIALICRWLEVKIFSRNSSLYLSKGFLVYDGKRPNNIEFSHKDFIEIIEEGQELLENLTDEFVKKPFLPEGKKVIYNFMYVFNTIVDISNNFNNLVKEHIKSLEKDANGSLTNEKERIKKEKDLLNNELNDIKEYFNQIQNPAGKNSKQAKITFGNGYYDKVFLGYGLSKSLDEASSKLAKDLLDINLENYVSKSPVYYELNKNSSPIIINCKAHEIKNGDYLSYLEDLSLYFVTALPAKKVRFAGIECNANTDGIIYQIFDRLKDIFYNEKTKSMAYEVIYSFGENIIAEDSYKAKELLTDLNSLIRSRKRKYSSFSTKYYENNAHSNFFDYNNRITDNQDELIVVVINNYPKGFESEENQTLLRNILDAKIYGIIPIILQDTTPSLYEKNNSILSNGYIKLPLENSTCNSISDIDDINSLITYNGKHLSYEENIYGLSHSELASEIKLKMQSISSFTTLDLMKKTNPENYSYLDTAMRFPIGLDGSKIFDFSTSLMGSPHSIILGGTGSGKTALLHSIILNAAATYSPDELEFYLSDFKGEKKSGAFGGFLKGKEMYIPHVKYLSLKASGSNTKDMLSMIKSIHNERMELISRCGYEDIVSYNNSKEVLGGSEEFPKLSRICFIIDEYAVMIERAGKNVNALGILSELLKLVRTSGIFIILCGQSDKVLSDDEIKQIGNRILLKGYTVTNVREFIHGGTDAVSDVNSFAIYAGRGCVSLNGGLEYTNVNLAFSGSVGSDLIKTICKQINNKYKNYKCDQIIAGDESLVDIQTDNKVSSLITKNFEYGYNLYIGQSSISYSPVAVRYHTSQKDNNYILTGEKEMIDRVKQNLILSFVQNILLTNQKSTGPRVFDCWLKVGGETDGDALAEFKKKYPSLKKYVKHSEDKYEIAETIMDIYNKQEKEQIKEPILLIVHGASALSTVGEYEYEETEEKSKHNYEALVEAQKEKFKEQLGANISAWSDADLDNFAKQAVDSYLAKVEVRHDNISCQLVRDCLKVLHRSGHLHNVFVLLAEGTYEYIEPFIKGNEKAEFSSISDRPEIKEEVNVTQYPTSCSHIKSTRYVVNEEESQTGKIVRLLTREEVDTKIKLYDYSLKSNKLWWEEFNKLLNN